MTDLIARLEAAETGSRELDLCIWCQIEYGGQPTEGNVFKRGLVLNNQPHYTTSLDVARSLSNWVLLQLSDIGADGLALAVLGNPAVSPAVEVSGVHSSPIMALCIAGMKTKQP